MAREWGAILEIEDKPVNTDTDWEKVPKKLLVGV